jgi:hypothetical protein
VLLLASAGACASSDAVETSSSGVGGATAGGTGAAFDGAGGSFGSTGGSSASGMGCDPPDVLIVQDRTESMHTAPDGKDPPDTPAGHAATKWYLAIDAVKQVTSGAIDTTIRFGLELFPRDPGGNACVTLAQRIEGIEATNPDCEKGEVLIEPNLATGAAITGALDPETTTLCSSTPIGLALATAQTALAKIANPTRKQFVLLVTDGENSCDVGPNPRHVVQELAQSGVGTYVVGFGSSGGVNPKLLNDLACAGMTAKNFPDSCKQDANGYLAADPTGPTLYYDAADGNALVAGLESIAGGVCCNCTPK